MKVPIFFIAFGLAFSLQAQNPVDNNTDNRPDHHRSHIEKMVSDLSAPQKKKLETLQKESLQRIKDLRHAKRVLGDSINVIMNLDGDNTEKLIPLFEREADIQVQISKEMYSTRLAVDKILTDKQRKEFKTNMEKQKAERTQAAKHKANEKHAGISHQKPIKLGIKTKKDCKKDGCIKEDNKK